MAEEIKPQQGPQEQFLSSPADIAIYGGAAGGGKTFALLLECIRHVNNPKFRAAIFRQTYPQIMQPGGLWEESEKLFPLAGGKAVMQPPTWKFPGGMKVTFNYLQTEADKLKYQGSQIPMIGFDELTHFSESQFFYLLSRVRSVSGVAGYIRATCNPDPDSWVRGFIAWWIGEDGLPIKERSGVVRWFVRDGGNLVWGDSKKELEEQFPALEPKSATFIPAGLEDNKILMEKDPSYRSNLLALPTVEREQLLGGNWDIRPAAGLYFLENQFQLIESHEVPELSRVVRYWDRAATEATQGTDPDWTAGVKMGITKDRPRQYVILDVERFRKGPAGTLQRIRQVAEEDGPAVKQILEQDPGQAGKVEAQYVASELAGSAVKVVPARGSKLVRATPYSSQVQAGNVMAVRGSWNREFFREHEAFDGSERGKDDQVDGGSGAFSELAMGKSKKFRSG